MGFKWLFYCKTPTSNMGYPFPVVEFRGRAMPPIYTPKAPKKSFCGADDATKNMDFQDFGVSPLIV